MTQSSNARHFLGLDTIPSVLAKRTLLTPDAFAHFSQDAAGAWRPTTWSDLAGAIERVADGLADLGLGRGKRVAILAATSQDWEICQVAALQLGATVIGIDPYYPEVEVNRIISELKPGVLIAGDQVLLQRIDSAILAQIRSVLINGRPTPESGIVALSTLKKRAGTGSSSRSAESVHGEDPAVIFFSSGTTGIPKPVVYTHSQICLACHAIVETFDDIEDGCQLVCWMPMANPFQRIINFCGFIRGAVTYFVSDPRSVMECVPIAKPHIFVTVPTFCERLYAGINENISKLPWPIRALVRSGIAANARENSLRTSDAPVPLRIRLVAAMARLTLLRRLRGVMGPNLKYIVSGAAPCPEWLLNAFAAIGIPIYEAYGQSEDAVPISANVPSAHKQGTVGRPLPHNTVRVSDEGVIEVKGPGVFHTDLAENRARPALTADGYLSTGDVGEILEGGYIKLTGRQADVFKTANGRWISPGVIEGVLRRIPYIDHACVLIRDGATILALLVISLQEYTRARGEGQNREFRLGDTDVQENVRADLVRELAALAPAIWPRGVLLTTRPFSVDGGELTSNLKLRRATISKQYDGALAGMSREIHEQQSLTATTEPMKIRVL